MKCDYNLFPTFVDRNPPEQFFVKHISENVNPVSKLSTLSENILSTTSVKG